MNRAQQEVGKFVNNCSGAVHPEHVDLVTHLNSGGQQVGDCGDEIDAEEE